jgi:prepilin-type N-terminal cleavage/methylation domain-containing protein
MNQSLEKGFTIIELMISMAMLLIVLGAALTFFSRSQVTYTNERVTLEMVQDMRTVFDRFTNEIRMAGAGLPYQQGVIEGSATQLVVRGDFSELTTIVTSTGSISISSSTATFPVGTTSGFAAGQTISLLNNATGHTVLAKITSVDDNNKTLTLDVADLSPISSGTTIDEFSAGAIINVIERRTYRIITTGSNKGCITRTVTYEDTLTPGKVIQAEEIIARNVLTEDDTPGLTFTYLKGNGDPAGYSPDTGELNSDLVRKVQINLRARSATQDLTTKKYRTFAYNALVQIRGQYAPGVGY